MYHFLARALGLRNLARRDEFDERAAVLTLFGRFADEVAAGLVIVLMPTLRARLGLSVTQVGWCFQALYSVGAVTDPIIGTALDLTRRRPWLVWGAAGWGGALLIAAGAPSFGWLVAAFALAGATSGALANTADVVLIDGHPTDAERVQGRSTSLDTIGALLAPTSVAIAGTAGVDQMLPMVVAGGGCLIYAVLLARAAVPGPTLTAERTVSVLGKVTGNVRRVLANRDARIWLVALLIHELFDIPELFEPVWLRSATSASQTLVAWHAALGFLATLAGLAIMDRWVRRHDPVRLLIGSCLATLVTYPAWLLTPGLVARFVLVVPRNLVMAPVWPILRARALRATPDAAGTVTALGALMGLVPLATLFGWLADRFGLTRLMLATVIIATVLLLTVLTRMPGPRTSVSRGN